jgi:hypothetical protein
MERRGAAKRTETLDRLGQIQAVDFRGGLQSSKSNSLAFGVNLV